MAIWSRAYSLSEVQALCRGNMAEHLGIEIVELGEDFLRGRMPVDPRTRQPAGLLHGGASVALAETLASVGGNLIVDRSCRSCVGLEINANHIRSARSGWVEGISRPIHIGGRTQVWETRIEQQGSLICLSRMTLAVLEAALQLDSPSS